MPDDVIETLLRPNLAPPSDHLVDLMCCAAFDAFQDLNQGLRTNQPEDCMHVVRHDHDRIEFDALSI